MNSRTRSVFALWLCAVVVLQGAKIKTRAESDPTFNFRELKTWAWDVDGAGDVIGMRHARRETIPRP